MKIKASVFAGIALGAVCAVQAQAADLGGGSYAVVNNWACRYVGGTLGIVDASTSVSMSPIFFWTMSVSGSGSQFGIGLIAGYNWQSGNQVFGLETDIHLPSGFDYFGNPSRPLRRRERQLALLRHGGPELYQRLRVGLCGI